jgi:cytochrome c biogenesis protein CcmG/thiol:disulfide interchange protein DsbE
MTRICALLAAVLLAGAMSAQAFGAGTAADFTRSDLSGNPVHLADYHGKVVLLNFWATWCGPCMEEIPVFARWQKQYGPAGLQVLGISMDDDEKSVQRYLQKTPLSYPIVMGDEALAKLYGGVLGLPLTYLIDANGKIAGRHLGGVDLAAVERQIKGLLAH